MNYEERIKNGIENQNIKKILKKIFLFLFFLFILSYGFFRSYDLIFGVKIKNVKMETIKITEALPMEASIGKASEENILNITGNAKNAINLMLNGREIPIDKKGDFNESIALLLGYNIISIEAHDKFGNSDKKDYKLVFQP